MDMVEVENVTKIFKRQLNRNWVKALIRPRYEEFKAVDSISFKIKKGETFGLLGANGAGKTTTIKMLCGLEHPSNGKIFIDGLELEPNFRRICEKFNVLFGDTMLYNRITAYDNLIFYSNIYSIENPEKKTNELLELVDLGSWKDQYVENFSLGMRMKLAIARSLINNPELIYLDEPTLGLDVNNAEFIRNMLQELDCTILLTTHYLNEAIMLCDRIGILLKGKLVHIGTPEDLKKVHADKRSIQIHTNDNNAVKKILEKNPLVTKITEKNKRLEVDIKGCENYFDILSEIQDYKLHQFLELKTGLEGLFSDVKDEPEEGN